VRLWRATSGGVDMEVVVLVIVDLVSDDDG
jgi:hypothetical protein